MILIGSWAAKFNSIDLGRRIDENEYDIIGTREEMQEILDLGFKAKESDKFPGKFILRKGETRVEFDATENQSNKILTEDNYGDFSNILCAHCPDGWGVEVLVPDVLVLYLIKRSHANFNVHFSKTLHDLSVLHEHVFEVETIDSIFDEYPLLKDFYDARHAEAKERFGKIQDRIKLNKSNEDFFKGGANLRVYEHDDIHRAVAYYDGKPMFEKCKIDLNSAKIEKILFQNLPREDRIRMVMEESMVIGIERHYATGEMTDQKQIFRAGFTKLTRDLCKGWFQDFILDNINRFDSPPWDFIEKFDTAVENGKVRKVK